MDEHKTILSKLMQDANAKRQLAAAIECDGIVNFQGKIYQIKSTMINDRYGVFQIK